MKEKSIQLKPESIERFVKIVSESKTGIELISGRTILDGNSILGLFAMDLTGPITMKIYGTDIQIENLCQALEEFIL